MNERIAVTFQKGGTGKTFTATNLAGGLAHRDYNVLLVDLDPQGSLTANLGFKESFKDLDRLSLDEVLRDVNKWENIDEIIETGHDEFDFIPANKTYTGNRSPLDSEANADARLDKVLDEITTEDYDYVVFDCPPALDAYTKNAIIAAEQVVIPVEAIFEMIHSTDLLLDMIDGFQKVHEIDVDYLAFLLNKVDYSGVSNQDEEMIEWFWDTFDQLGYELRERAAFDRSKWDGGKSIYAHSEAKACDQFPVFDALVHEVNAKTDPEVELGERGPVKLPADDDDYESGGESASGEQTAAATEA